MKSQKKTLLHVHWVSENDSRMVNVNLYETLFKSRDPMLVEDWIGDINPNSLIVKANARVPKFAAESAKDGKSYKVY